MFLSTMIVTFNGSIDSVLTGFFWAIDANGSYMVLLCLLPIFPYALVYVREWNERATPFWMIRTGVRPYMVAKLIVTAVSAFLAVFLGILLYACTQRLFLPWGSVGQGGIHYDGDSVAICLLLTASYKGVSAMLVAVCALWVSLYISNVYAALIGPSILYWLALRLDTFSLPPILSPTYWIQAYGGGGMYHWTVSYGMHWLLILVLCVLMGMNAVGRLRKKVEHD